MKTKQNQMETIEMLIVIRVDSLLIFIFDTQIQKCERNLPPEWRKFSVDPQITSLEVLYSILAKAFDLKTDFSISYKTLDPNGQEVHLPVLSDWDLDAAFLR